MNSDGSRSTGYTDSTPAHAPTRSDTLDAALASVRAISDRFVESGSISYADRAALVQDLRIAVAEVDAIEQAQQ